MRLNGPAKLIGRDGLAALVVIAVLIAMCVAARLLPHPPNFAPVTAAVLFASYWSGRALFGVGAAALALFVSDLFIGFYDWRVMAVVYGTMLAPALYGSLVLAHRLTGVRLIGGAFGAAVLFYLTTNAAVWAFGSLYPKTVAGLMTSYVNALPFFKYSLASDVIWTAVLFGGYVWMRARSGKANAVSQKGA